MTPWSPPRLLDRPTLVALTPRQAQVLSGICRGRSNLQIGNELGVSEDTVKTHSRRLYARIGARDRGHAAALAAQLTVVVDDGITDWSNR